MAGWVRLLSAYRRNSDQKVLALDWSPLKMVGGTPLSPPLEVGAVGAVGAVVGAGAVPVVPADMVVGWMRGTVGAVGTGFTWPVATGSMVEVWWVVLELGSVGVL